MENKTVEELESEMELIEGYQKLLNTALMNGELEKAKQYNNTLNRAIKSYFGI